MAWVTHAPKRVNFNMIAADGGAAFVLTFNSFIIATESIVDMVLTIKDLDDNVVFQLSYVDAPTRWDGISLPGADTTVSLLPGDTDGLNDGTYFYFIRQTTSGDNVLTVQYGTLVINRIGSTSPAAVASLIELKFNIWALFVDRLFTNITYEGVTFKILTADIVWPDQETGTLTINSYDVFDEPDNFDCSYGSTYNIHIQTVRDSSGRLTNRTITVEAL